MRGVLIPFHGEIEVVELGGDVATDLMPALHQAIGCDSLETLRLTRHWDGWIDANIGLVRINTRATRLAWAFSAIERSRLLCGTIVITGADRDGATSVDLTDEQIEGILRRVSGLHRAA